jgi:hypothetical protein
MSEVDDLPKPERVPFFQRVLDWGIMEIATIPVAP